MKTVKRRTFIKNSASTAGGVLIAPSFIPNLISDSPNERVNVAVIGCAGKRAHDRGIINGRGIAHVNAYAEMDNVSVKTLCDVDERLYPGMAKIVEEKFGIKPGFEYDMRKILEDKAIDVISIATPDHWHALQTIWACQAGKNVYVEKPSSHNIWEGRKMVEAVEKYNTVVQSGICYRSSRAVKEGIQLIHDGILGDVYMARGITWRYREPIGTFKNSAVPEGVHWDLFLGPAPYREFNINRFLYHWHWFWDTGTADMGNNGIYRMDTARWALNKNTQPVKVNCSGGLFGRGNEQETPNIMDATYVYDDGMIIQNEVRGLPVQPEGAPEDKGVVFVYGDKGFMSINGNSYKTYFGKNREPGPKKSDKDFPPETLSNGWKNLVDCVRSGNKQNLDKPMIEGHLSASLCHLGTIAYRVGHELHFDPEKEKFFNDEEANQLVSRKYRTPYIIPEKV